MSNDKLKYLFSLNCKLHAYELISYASPKSLLVIAVHIPTSPSVKHQKLNVNQKRKEGILNH